MEPQADGRVNFPQASGVVANWLRHRSEPFDWGIRRAELAGFLAELGFVQAELADEEVLRARYLAAPQLSRLPLAVGELISVATASKE